MAKQMFGQFSGPASHLRDCSHHLVWNAFGIVCNSIVDFQILEIFNTFGAVCVLVLRTPRGVKLNETCAQGFFRTIIIMCDDDDDDDIANGQWENATQYIYN